MDKNLLRSILRREHSLFDEDYSANKYNIAQSLHGTKVLIIGASGSVGSAVVKQISAFNLVGLHLVDIDENSLVEVVRDLRSSQMNLPKDFKAMPLDFGSLEFHKFVKSKRYYDFILNFAALKHVRSEKDPYSLMRMYNTNVYYLKLLLDLFKGSSIRKIFSVSSDKAVNPFNIMGATKIFMERLLLAYSDTIPFSTTRFANVAFSNGSLLHSFEQRLSKNQPITAPLGIKRYFISHEEAAQLCLLSCILGDNRDIFLPKIAKVVDPLYFTEIANIFLENKGYRVEMCGSEDEAKEKASKIRQSSKKWPCYFTNSDTTGEKSLEEFFTNNDLIDKLKYRNIWVIHQSQYDNQHHIYQAIESFERIKKSKIWDKHVMVNAIKIAVPELKHEERQKNLDQKM